MRANAKLPADIDFSRFLSAIDEHPDLKDVRVVYFDGAEMMSVREGPPACAPGMRAIVIKPNVDESTIRSNAAAEGRESKLYFELLAGSLSCASAALAWVVVVGSAGAAPVTGGASTFVTYLAGGAAVANSVQCVNSMVRVSFEVWAPENNDWLDTKEWYTTTANVLDAISLTGAGTSAAATVRMVLALRRTTGKPLVDVLKGLSRQERKRIAEEAIRIDNPGISNQALKTMVNLGKYPKRYTDLQISHSVRLQLKEAIEAAISFSGSAVSGLVRQAGAAAYGTAVASEKAGKSGPPAPSPVMSKYVIGVAKSFETY